MAYAQPYYWASMLLGILLPIFAYSNNKLQDKNRRHQLLFFSGNLFFVTANLSIALSILVITGGNVMSPSDIANFTLWAKIMTVASIIIFGIVIGLILTDGIEKRKINKQTKLENKIRLLAYHLWESNGKQSGHEIDYWLQAKSIIKGHFKK